MKSYGVTNLRADRRLGTCVLQAQIELTGDIRAFGTELSTRMWNTVSSFVCFEHCIERCLCPYRRLLPVL